MLAVVPRAAPALALALATGLALTSVSVAAQATGGSSAAIRAAVAADSARILSDMAWLADDARRGRAAGTPGAAAVARYLARAFEEAGLRFFEGGPARPFALPPGEAEAARGVNVVGWLPGTDAAQRWIVVTAHYDHLGVRDGEIYNGADDNASGTAALLHLARRLAARPLRHPVVLAALDAEESGLRGARALLSDPPVPVERVAVNLNLDMLARTGGTLWAAGAWHTPALRPVLEGVAHRAPLRLRLGHDRPGVPGRDDWTRSSDHAPFHEAGIPFVYLGVEDHPDYHRPTDDVARIDPSEYLDAVATTVLVLEALDRALPLNAPGGGPADPGLSPSPSPSTSHPEDPP